jgi:O-acetyl-ADP-ribose deacetylase (regulator of RNase III)
MSLEYFHGDILAVEADTKVITINLVGAMGAGVARQARNNVPGLYTHYKKMYPTIEPGQFISYKYDGVLYLLIPTKLDWKKPSPRSLVIHNINRLAVLANQYPHMGTIALPPMGCGNGGLDWEKDISLVYKAIFPYHEKRFITVLNKR